MTFDLDKASRWEKFWRKLKWFQGRRGAADLAAKPPSFWGRLIAFRPSGGLVLVAGVALGAVIYMQWTKHTPDSPPVQAGTNLRGREQERSGSGTAIRQAPPPPSSAPVPERVVHDAGLWRLEPGTTHGGATEVGASAGRAASLAFDLPDFSANYWLDGVPETMLPGTPFRVTLHGNISPKTRERVPAALAEVLAEGFGGDGAKSAQVRVVAGQGDQQGAVQGIAPTGRPGAQAPRFVLRAWNADRWVVLPYRWEVAR